MYTIHCTRYLLFRRIWAGFLPTLKARALFSTIVFPGGTTLHCFSSKSNRSCIGQVSVLGSKQSCSNYTKRNSCLQNLRYYTTLLFALRLSHKFIIISVLYYYYFAILSEHSFEEDWLMGIFTPDIKQTEPDL